MNQLFTYADPKTGYAIRQYTKGEQRSAKLYFTTENFTTDDRYFFFRKQVSQDGMNPQSELYRTDVESGECEMGAGSEYAGFAMDRNENYGVMVKGDIVCRLDCDTGRIAELGALPPEGRVTGHLTTS